VGIAKAVARQLGHRIVPLFKVKPAGDGVDVVAEERYLAYEAMGWMDYFLDHERFFLDTLSLLNACERGGLPAGVSRGSSAVGVALELAALPRLARGYILRAVDLAERIGDPVATGFAYLASGVHGFHLADLEAAIVDCSRAAAAYKEAGHLRGWGASTALMSAAMRFKGSFSECLKTSEEILRVGVDSGDVELRGWGLWQTGRVLRLMGDLEQGLRLSEESIKLFDSIPDYVSSAAVLSDIGMCHLDQGRPERALEIMEEAQRLIADRGLRGISLDQTRIALAECRLQIAELEHGSERSNSMAKARRASRAALRYSRTARGGVPAATRVNGTRLWLKGRHAAARKWWQRSLAAAEQSGARHDLGLTELEMGRRLNEPARIERAAAILGELGAELDYSRAQAALKLIDR
jgi:tetratricopeptide (TPR) repeat protein